VLIITSPGAWFCKKQLESDSFQYRREERENSHLSARCRGLDGFRPKIGDANFGLVKKQLEEECAVQTARVEQVSGPFDYIFSTANLVEKH
jgi:hypothetical protein